MTKRLAILIALLIAALVGGCSTAAPAPTATKAPAAPTATQAAVPTKAAAPTTAVAAPTTAAAPTAPPATAAPAASNYPNKPITWIVPYAAGQGPDLASRYVAAEMEKELGQKIVVEDKPGGGTVIGVAEIAAAKPDGYTMGWVAVWAVDYLPMIQETPFKGIVDFTPIANIHQTNGALVVKAESPWKTFQDLMDEAKKSPGKVTWGIQAGLKGLGHIQALLIAKSAGVKFNYLPLNASGIPDILGGTLDSAIEGTSTAVPQIKSGKLRALFANYDSEDLPGIPTAKSLGINMVLSTGALMGPKGMPADVVAKLDAAAKKVLTSEAFAKFEKNLNFTPMYLGPADIAKEAARMAAAEKEIATEQGWLLKKN